MMSAEGERPAFVIEIQMAVNCKRCGRKGATQCGYCLRCVGDFMAAERLIKAEKRPLDC